MGREAQVNPEPPEDDEDHEDSPALIVTRRNLIALAGFLLASLAALYFLLPQLAGLDDTWNADRGRPPRLDRSPRCCSRSACSAATSRCSAACSCAPARGSAGRRESYQITMAGLAASRLFAAGGAGGLVLTAWALRRSGMRKRTVADKTISFLVLTYLPYAVAVVVCGFGLHWGLFSGADPFSLTFVPAVVGARAAGDRARDRASSRPTCSGACAGSRREGRLGRLTQQARRGAGGDVGRACATRSSTCARAIRRCSARCCSGRSRSRCCGRRSTRSATRRRSRCSSRRSSSACSATCCRCRAASAASRAA